MAVTNPERTIAEAAREVLHTEGKPLTASQVYDAIVQNGLYEFHASNPRHVVANQLRRHARGYEKAASSVKYFTFVDNGRFALLPEEEQGQVRRRQQTRAQRANAVNGVSLSAIPRQVPLVEGQEGFAAARKRWSQRRMRLLDAEGGAISTEQVAHTLNTTPTAIEKSRQEGALLGLHGDRDGYVYPVWQFDHGRPIRGLTAVLQELQGVGPWMRAAFMLTGDAHLAGERPLDVLRRGKIEAVIAAAREYGEQGGG